MPSVQVAAIHPTPNTHPHPSPEFGGQGPRPAILRTRRTPESGAALPRGRPHLVVRTVLPAPKGSRRSGGGIPSRPVGSKRSNNTAVVDTEMSIAFKQEALLVQHAFGRFADAPWGARHVRRGPVRPDHDRAVQLGHEAADRPRILE